MARNETTATSTVLLNGEQAKNQLEILEAKAKALRKSIKEAAEVGDLAGLKKYNKELTVTQREMKQVRSEAFDAKKVLDDISGSSLKDLYAAQKKIDNLLKNGTVKRNSAEWKELVEQQKKVKTEISNVNAEMSVGESRTSKWANGFNKYFAVITAGVAALTGLTLGLKKFMDMRNEVEDSAANLKSLTGLGDQDIEWLRQYAKELSTTTTEAGVRITASAKEIMNGFTTIGSKRPELLKNKEAMAAVTKEALTLAAAGKMDVATAFDVVTASMNQFNLGASESGRIINVIAAGSLEGSAEADSLAGSLKNVGTVADGSNMTLEDTVALLEVLASKQLMGEEAGTKLRGAILKMKDAGVGYVSGAFNMRDAIIEVNKQLSKKTSAAEKDALMQKIFGAENITVGQILVKNVDAYDKLKVAVTDTNTAYKQAVVQTDTVSAKMAQAKNKFNEAGMALVKNLNPAILSAMNLTTKLIKGMASVASVSQSTTESFEAQKNKVMDLKLNLEPLLGRYDELATKAKRSTEENAELKKIVDKVALAMPGAVTEVDKYGNAIAISTTRVREYIDAQVALYGVKNKEQIKDTEKSLADTEKSIAFHKKKIDEINKTGTFKVRTVSDKKTGDVYDIFATKDEIAAEQALYKKLIQDRLGYQEYIKELSGKTLEEDLKNRTKKRNEELAAEKKARDEEAARRKKEEEEAKKNAGKQANLDDKKSKKADKTPFEIGLEKLEDKYKDDELQFKNSLANKEMEQYDSETYLFVAKAEFLRKKIELEKKYGKDTTESEIALADLIISENERAANEIQKQADQSLKDTEKDNKEKEKLEKDHLEKIKQIRSEFGLDRLRLTYAQELDLLKEKLAAEQATEEETAQAIADFKKRLAEDYVNDTATIAAMAGQALDNLVEMETTNVETKYERQIAAAEKAGQDTTELQEKMEEEKKAIKKKYAGIDFAITSAKIISETAAAIMKASPNVPLQIAEGILGATQLGIATAEFNKVQNLWTGGYTEPGGKYEPRGIVHAGEFVANQDAVGNKTLRRLFNVVDYAQKTNTVGRIDNATIANALAIKQGYASGGYVAPVGSGASPDYNTMDMAAMMAVMQQSNEVNAALLAELKNGIVAKAQISGNNGIAEQLNKYNNLIKNS